MTLRATFSNRTYELPPTGGAAVTKDGFVLTPSRDDLARMLDDYQEAPWWSSGNESAASDIGSQLSRLDRELNELLHASSAVCLDAPPPIRLVRIARKLNAEVLLRDEPKTRFRPLPDDVSTASRTGWQRGILKRHGNDRWLVIAGSRSAPSSRYSVAHELSHALLFTSSGRTDVDRWARSEWKEQEEAICNYLARAMLAPASLIKERLADRRDVNLAVELVSGIQARFNMPMHSAALRLLDVARDCRRQCRGIVFWRQRHPLGEWFVRKAIHQFCRHHRAAKPYERVLKQCALEMASDAKKKIDVTDFRLAGQFWRHVCALMCHVETDGPAWLSQVIDRCTAPLDDEQRDCMARASTALRDGGAPLSFHPQWAVWRGDWPSIYRREQGLGGNYLAGRLAKADGTADGIETEAVRLCEFEGTYRVHGFSHGRANEGSRYVLTVFEELQ